MCLIWKARYLKNLSIKKKKARSDEISHQSKLDCRVERQMKNSIYAIGQKAWKNSGLQWDLNQWSVRCSNQLSYESTDVGS